MTSPSVLPSDAREHWRQLLRCGIDDAGVPADRIRPERLGNERAEQPIRVTGDVFDRLDRVSGGGRFLQYTILNAALKVSLRRHSAATRIAVGSPLRRGTGETQARTLPTIDSVRGSEPFHALLERVRETLLAAYANQNVDPQALLAELDWKTSVSRHPFFDLVLRLDAIHGPIGSGEHDMEIDLHHADGGLAGTLRYRAAMWDRGSMQAFWARFETTLGQLLHAPHRPVGAAEGLPAEQRAALLRAAKGPDCDRSLTTLHELVLARAEQTPNAVAIQSMVDGQVIPGHTYRGLVEAARHLAGALAGGGAAPGAVVAVALGRGPELIPSLLAVLMTGAAYLPLDPEGPAQRRRLMLQRANVRIAIANSTSRAAIEADVATVVSPADGGPPFVAVDVSADSPAYVIFTSGSTGEPKGVLVPHRGVANYVCWACDTYDYRPQRAVPLHGAIDTDLCVTALWAPLVAGAPVLLLEEGLGTDPLAEALRLKGGLGVVKLTPMHLTALSYGMSDNTHEPPNCLVVGGEVFRTSLASMWLRHDVPQAIYNEYGPTETTVGSTVHRVDALLEHETVPIGRPIDNTRAYIVTHDGQLAPRGVVGELQIGGWGVANGYVGRPDLTADRFVPDPFASEPGARLYRTGDLARDAGDGILHFLGRDDDQVKIRGHRVEPGEIAVVLEELDGIAEAVVLPRPTRGGVELVAYLVTAGQAQPMSVLRRALRQRLPDAMVPSRFIAVDSIPRHASGKVDRTALPSPEPVEFPPTDGQSPTTDVGGILTAIWSRVLEVPDVGLNDNFFELGGDSVLSVHVIAEARHAGLKLPLNDLFQFPTIAQLLPRVTLVEVAALARTPTDVTLPLLPIQRWWLRQGPREPFHFNQSLLLGVASDIDPGRLTQALQRVVDCHEALRTRYVKTSDGYVQTLPATTPHVVLGQLDVRALPPEARPQVLEDEATRWQRSISLDRGELVRAWLVTDGSDRARLLIVIHHLASDMASWTVFLSDLAHTWDTPDDALPPPALTPWAWAAMLQDAVAGGRFDDEIDDWTIGSDTRPAVPPSYAGEDPHGAVERSLAGGLSARLSAVPRAYPTTIEEILLAAAAATLAETH